MLNPMIRWTPANSYLAAREPLFKFIDSVLGDAQGEEIAARTWTPPVDVQETEDAYKLYAELPGLKKEDIQITLENNVLRLSGERKFERDVKKDNFQRIERTYGSFTRAFALPTQVNSEGVLAVFVDGVLTVTVPKKEESKPRAISIS